MQEMFVWLPNLFFCLLPVSLKQLDLRNQGGIQLQAFHFLITRIPIRVFKWLGVASNSPPYHQNASRKQGSAADTIPGEHDSGTPKQSPAEA